MPNFLYNLTKLGYGAQRYNKERPALKLLRGDHRVLISHPLYYMFDALEKQYDISFFQMLISEKQW